jgi:hypothetical protein
VWGFCRGEEVGTGIEEMERREVWEKFQSQHGETD